MLKVYRYWAVTFVAFTASVVVVSAEGERDASLYVGLKSCRMCHKKDESGNQVQKWLDGPHSKAYATLAGKEAKESAAKLGIDDPQKSPKCLKCHSTVYNFTEEVKTDKVDLTDGVACESCHGPGANYKSKTVMKDRDQCIEKGMIYPATKSCTLCHNDSAPSWKPDRYTTKDGKKTGFDVEQAYKKIEHPNPNLHK